MSRRRRSWSLAVLALLASGGLVACGSGTPHSVTYTVEILPGPGGTFFPLQKVEMVYGVNGEDHDFTVEGDNPLPWSKTLTFHAKGDITTLSVMATFQVDTSMSSDRWPKTRCRITLDGKEMVEAGGGGAGTGCLIDAADIKQMLGR